MCSEIQYAILHFTLSHGALRKKIFMTVMTEKSSGDHSTLAIIIMFKVYDDYVPHGKAKESILCIAFCKGG